MASSRPELKGWEAPPLRLWLLRGGEDASPRGGSPTKGQQGCELSAGCRPSAFLATQTRAYDSRHHRADTGCPVLQVPFPQEAAGSCAGAGPSCVRSHVPAPAASWTSLLCPLWEQPDSLLASFR